MRPLLSLSKMSSLLLQMEPVGGAARFLTAVKSKADLQPLVLFSGDIFAPSISKCIQLFGIVIFFHTAVSPHQDKSIIQKIVVFLSMGSCVIGSS